MADKKISALTGASTPLAGTEVLPIVQSGSTKKVSVADLTAGRAVGMAGGSFTDNITQSTAAKGVNFTANTPAAGMTSQLLNWYEEGTWTPTDASGAALTFSTATGKYTRIGRMVFAQAAVTYPSTADGSNAKIGGLPFTVANAQDARQGFISVTDESTLTNILPSPNGTDIQLLNSTGGNITNATMSGNYVYFTAVYYV